MVKPLRAGPAAAQRGQQIGAGLVCYERYGLRDGLDAVHGERDGVRPSIEPAAVVLHSKTAGQPALHGIINRLPLSGAEVQEVRRLTDEVDSVGAAPRPGLLWLCTSSQSAALWGPSSARWFANWRPTSCRKRR